MTILTAILFQFSGCSIVGYNVGKMIDRTEDARPMPAESAMNLKPGEEVRVTLADSTAAEGTYKGMSPLGPDVYDALYGKFLARTAAGDFPNIGDTLELATTKGWAQGGLVFRGFGVRTMHFCRANEHDTVSIALAEIVALTRGNGKRFDAAMLTRLNYAGTVPRDAAVVIQGSAGEVRIPFDDIAAVAKVRNGKAKWIGLGIGVVIDVAVAVTAVTLGHAFSRWRGWGKP